MRYCNLNESHNEIVFKHEICLKDYRVLNHGLKSPKQSWRNNRWPTLAIQHSPISSSIRTGPSCGQTTKNGLAATIQQTGEASNEQISHRRMQGESGAVRPGLQMIAINAHGCLEQTQLRRSPNPSQVSGDDSDSDYEDAKETEEIKTDTQVSCFELPSHDRRVVNTCKYICTLF